MRQPTDLDNGRCPFRVLHIDPSHSDGNSGSKIAEGLKQLNILPEHELDVYRGLALLARSCHGELSHAEKQEGNAKKTSSQLPTFAGIVVCVDELVLAEHEFFEITAQYDDLCGVYVYSCYGDSGSVQRAIAHGAAGELTDEVLAELRSAIVDSLSLTEPKSAIETSVTKGATDESLPDNIEETTLTIPKLVIPEVPQPEVSNEAEGDTATSPGEETAEDEYIDDEEDDDMIGPVQVPWDRRPAPPQRSAPPQQPTASPSSSSEAVNPNRTNGNSEGKKSSQGRRTKRQPLLSPEELRALIGEIEKKEPLEDQPQGDHESA